MMLLRGLLATIAVGTVTAGCDDFDGKWHDSASNSLMTVTSTTDATGCMLVSKYGKTRVDGDAVAPVDGLLKALEMQGKSLPWHGEGMISWSNGMTWMRTKKDSTTSLQVLDRLTELETMMLELRRHVANLTAQLENVTATCCGGSSVPNGQQDEIQQLREEMANLTQLANGTTGPPGKDGYCTITPNVTSIYVPVTRFVYRDAGNAANRCVIGGTAIRAGSSSGSPSMRTQATITAGFCKWTTNMYNGAMHAYLGDELVFWRGSSKIDLWKFKDEKAFKECDFDRADLLAGKKDFEGLEIAGKNFSLELDAIGSHYFGSSSSGKPDPDRREQCWDSKVTPFGVVSSKRKGWGKNVKLEVQVLNPTEEVMAECPLYDPAAYGVGATPGQVPDSATVDRLKGAVAAMGRQLISYETRIQQRVREQGQSGVTFVRAYGQGTDAYHSSSHTGGGAIGLHNHANFHHTMGMGEFGAVLNGVQFSTRHNDYSLVEPDDSLTVAQYTSSWPPKAKNVNYPEVPPSVTAAGNPDAQATEMREYFRAFHTQNVTHRDFRDYFKPVMCYLEGAWVEAQGDLAEPFASERHHVDADSWSDLNDKTNFLFQNGQKNNQENLPFLPTAIRSMLENGDDTFEPHLAQWFYRITCKPLNQHISTKRFRVRNELHVQLKFSKPATREMVAKTPRALFDLNPTAESRWKEDAPWPKGQTTYEFIDSLMEQLSGFDGPNGDLLDTSFGSTCGKFKGTQALNTAKYSRYYSMLEKDAMGRTEKKRAFNDYMFAAQTTHKKVNPQKVCAQLSEDALKRATQRDKDHTTECSGLKSQDACSTHTQWDKAELDGEAVGAKCAWARGKCVYKKCWKQRWSYAIPLEVVYLTPLTKWNPFNIEYYERSDPKYNSVSSGRNGKKGTPYKGSRQNLFFRTPASFFKDAKNVDAADTSGGVTYVEDKNGKEHEVRASGHWILFPEIDGIGRVRQRYPIFPVHEHGNTIWKETKALQELLVGGKSPALKSILEETRSEAYGAELKLLTGGGHSHEVHISPSKLLDLKNGKIASTTGVSSLADGHDHYVKVSYDRNAAPGSEWSLDYCTMSADKKKCPTMPAGDCGQTSGGVACCSTVCPDGHSGVEPIL